MPGQVSVDVATVGHRLQIEPVRSAIWYQIRIFAAVDGLRRRGQSDSE
jgi:hypothetical protein